jgi:hypothetical protein
VVVGGVWLSTFVACGICAGGERVCAGGPLAFVPGAALGDTVFGGGVFGACAATGGGAGLAHGPIATCRSRMESALSTGASDSFPESEEDVQSLSVSKIVCSRSLPFSDGRSGSVGGSFLSLSGFIADLIAAFLALPASNSMPDWGS